MSKYNATEAIEAQKKYVKENGGPHFAPKHGICWKCHKNIYEPQEKTRIVRGEEKKIITGITIEEAGNRKVTGCPHCNNSYCS